MTIELYHSGIKGMKWGVRKQRKEEAKIRKLARTFEHRGDKYANALRKHDRRIYANPTKSNRGSSIGVMLKMFPYASAYSKLRSADNAYKQQTGKSYLEKMLASDSKYANMTVSKYLNRVNEHKISNEVRKEIKTSTRNA